MGRIHVAIAVLSLLSSGLSAPATNCETLIQPLEISGREQLLGKWLHVAESTNIQVAEEIVKNFQESYWLKITAANETDALILTSSGKGLSACVSLTFKTTLENSTLALSPSTANATLATVYKSGPIQSMELLKTSCPDCLVLLTQMQDSAEQTFTLLQLLGKTRNVAADHLSEFEQQAKCLKLRPTYGLNPDTADTELCPEPSTENAL